MYLRLDVVMPRQRKPRGRLPKYVMPEQISDTPENLARDQFRKRQPKTPEDWEFMKEHRRQQAEQANGE